MKWTIASLPAWHQAMLAEVAMARGLPGTLCYFADRSNGRLLSVLLVAGLAATAIGAEISSALLRESARVWPAAVGLGLTALALLWSALAAVEAVRYWLSELRPFLLLTPKVLLICEHAHGVLAGYRLADATDFRASERYGYSQRYRGREYRLVFPGDAVIFLAKSRQDIDLIEQILAKARAGDPESSGQLQLLPGPELQARRPWLREFTNPYGLFWIVTAGLLCAAALVGHIASRWIS